MYREKRNGYLSVHGSVNKQTPMLSAQGRPCPEGAPRVSRRDQAGLQDGVVSVGWQRWLVWDTVSREHWQGQGGDQAQAREQLGAEAAMWPRGERQCLEGSSWLQPHFIERD